MFQVIDLTHTLHPDMPTWNGGGCGFQHIQRLDYEDKATPDDIGFRVQQIKMHAGIGTHMDAPAHCVPHGKTIDQMDINSFFAPCVVIDISGKAHADYQCSLGDVYEHEATYGKIAPNCLVFICTGWDRFWSTPTRYHNNHQFPSVSKEVALYLLEKEIVGIGIDTLSPDCPHNGFPVHERILGAGKYIIENAANLSKLPLRGSYAFALPLKTAGGTEAPMRLVGLINKE